MTSGFELNIFKKNQQPKQEFEENQDADHAVKKSRHVNQIKICLKVPKEDFYCFAYSDKTMN